jgi:pimeloyl-ACP methyl ester carboxylesterase
MEGLIEAAGFKIFTKVEGQGSPLVLLHSLWGNHCLFDNLSRFLSHQYQIIRVDFPGHGNSPLPEKNFSFEELAIGLNQVLEQLNIREEINLLGHSMGGFAAMAFARHFQEKVASLILVHTLAKGPDSSSIRHRLRQAELIRRDRKNLLLQLANESNFAPGNTEKFPHFYAAVKAASDSVSPQGALAAIHAINTRSNSLPFLMKAQFPTLIVIGRHDRIYNPEEQLWEQKNISMARLLWLEHSGHLGFFEEENLFNQQVEAFLVSVPSLKLTV